VELSSLQNFHDEDQKLVRDYQEKEAEYARLKELFKGLQKTNDQAVAACLALDAELQTKNNTIEQLEKEKAKCISTAYKYCERA